MKKVLYFDVEWANAKNKSICQIGLMSEDFDTKDPIYPELNIYINPNDGFDQYCVAVHHITKEKVKDEKTFDLVWKDIEPYFTNSIIVGHNVKSSDLNALVKNLKRYNLNIPQFYYIDTYDLAKNLISEFLVENYSLRCLCDYYQIDMDNAHDAFDDACACSDLLRAMILDFNINIDDYIEKYEFDYDYDFKNYIASPEIRREINQLYGFIQAIGMDKIVDENETKYLIDWKNKYISLKTNMDLKAIFDCLENIIDDNRITYDELKGLSSVVSLYIHNIEGRIETLATQQLQGILTGINIDKTISNEEIYELSKWLYKNDYLRGHYPYDKLIEEVSNVLLDNKITQSEKDELEKLFSDLIQPLDKLKNNIVIFENKRFCLSGNFNHGDKSEVSKYIENKGGFIDSTVKKTTDYVVVGGLGSDAYSNGSYGTKVKKALELGIIVIKENDIY